jgi:hypothetical protein
MCNRVKWTSCQGRELTDAGLHTMHMCIIAEMFRLKIDASDACSPGTAVKLFSFQSKLFSFQSKLFSFQNVPIFDAYILKLAFVRRRL